MVIDDPPAGSDVVVNLSSDNAAALPPGSAVVTAGTASASFTVSTTPVASEAIAHLTASASGVVQQTSVRVEPAELSAVTVTPASVANGGSASGTVSLNGVAAAPVTIALATSDQAVTVPSSVVVAAGSSSTTFQAHTALFWDTNLAATISATHGSVVRSAALTVIAPSMASLTITPSAVTGGANATAQATLDAPAPSLGANVTFSSTDCTDVPVPPAITIPGMATSGQGTVVTVGVAATTSAVVSATANGVARSAPITLQPAAVTFSSLSIPSSVVGSADLTGTVTLTAAAPAGGIDVDLFSGNQVQAPAFIHVPAGSSSATFTATSSAVSYSIQGYVGAKYSAAGVTDSVWVNPVPGGYYVTSLSVAPTVLTGGAGATGTVTFNAQVTANGGLTVNLTSSNSAVLSVPSKVTVKKGSNAVTFSISTKSVSTGTGVTITASYGGGLQRAQMVVLPPNAVTLSSFSIDQTIVLGGTSGPPRLRRRRHALSRKPSACGIRITCVPAAFCCSASCSCSCFISVQWTRGR